MIVKALIRPNSYFDSLILMRAQTQMVALPGVIDAALMMATEQNRRIMDEAFRLPPEMESADTNDLVCVVAAETEGEAQAALDAAIKILTAGRAGVDSATHTPVCTLESALWQRPDTNLALLSIPGRYVRREALKALRAGLNLFIFSDNVPLEDEIHLKRIAHERNLLVMGPDCGTAIIGGVALAFANRVRRGRIGLVGASGTGLQEVSCLIDRLGHGVSHAIGTGSRDVSAEVGGVSLIQGLGLLGSDQDTDVIVVVSKPPALSVAQAVMEVVHNCPKPVVACFLGSGLEVVRGGPGRLARTLEEAAISAVAVLTGEQKRVVRRQLLSLEALDYSSHSTMAEQARIRLTGRQQYVRGLYSGGTFAGEAALLLSERLDPVYSNITIGRAVPLPDPRQSKGHTCVDLGDDIFTLGRPHPMLEPTMRRQRLLAEADDPETAVILLDVVLGYGVHPDPAGELVHMIAEAKARPREAGRELVMIASICGVDADPQCRSDQVQKLTAAGVLVTPSNATAARLAADIVTGD